MRCGTLATFAAAAAGTPRAGCARSNGTAPWVLVLQLFTRQDVLMVSNVCVASTCLALALGTAALLAWRVHQGQSAVWRYIGFDLGWLERLVLELALVEAAPSCQLWGSGTSCQSTCAHGPFLGSLHPLLPSTVNLPRPTAAVNRAGRLWAKRRVHTVALFALELGVQTVNLVSAWTVGQLGLR